MILTCIEFVLSKLSVPRVGGGDPDMSSTGMDGL